MADELETVGSNQDNFSKISISELLKKYDIGRDSLYARMRYLQITTWKVSGKAYLDSEQVTQMDGLHEHIKTNGRMEGYPVPEPSGPIEEDEQPAPTTTLAVAENQQVTPTYSPQQRRSQSSEQVDNVRALVESAQNKATAVMIAENLLARQFIENPDLLPDELRQKIKEAGEMPSIDPFAYAESLMGLARLAS